MYSGVVTSDGSNLTLTSIKICFFDNPNQCNTSLCGKVWPTISGAYWTSVMVKNCSINTPRCRTSESVLLPIDFLSWRYSVYVKAFILTLHSFNAISNSNLDIFDGSGLGVPPQWVRALFCVWCWNLHVILRQFVIIILYFSLGEEYVCGANIMENMGETLLFMIAWGSLPLQLWD